MRQTKLFARNASWRSGAIHELSLRPLYKKKCEFLLKSLTFELLVLLHKFCCFESPTHLFRLKASSIALNYFIKPLWLCLLF